MESSAWAPPVEIPTIAATTAERTTTNFIDDLSLILARLSTSQPDTARYLRLMATVESTQTGRLHNSSVDDNATVESVGAVR